APPAPDFAGASDDLSRIVFLNPAGRPSLLSEDTHAEGRGLYGSHDGQLEFIGVDAAGNPLSCGAVVANDEGFNVGNGFEQSGVSADGDTVAFESPDPESGCPEPLDLYLHRNGHSIDISAPRPSDPAYGEGSADEGAAFVGMSRDGDQVYFTTRTRLDTVNDTDPDTDLYRYDAVTDSVTDLVPGASVSKVTVSPQGDFVYFVAANPI